MAYSVKDNCPTGQSSKRGVAKTAAPQHSSSAQQTYLWDAELQDEIDASFIQRVIEEVNQSCALPFSMPTDRIPAMIIQAAQWFWENVDFACEERCYVILNKSVCKNHTMNKIIQLPQQIMSVVGVYKVQEDLKYGAMGDFSIERMMMSSYSMFGGAGLMTGDAAVRGGTGYRLSDITMSLFEVSTFNQFLNPPITYNFSPYSSKLVLLGDLGYSDLLIRTFVRSRIQDLYNSYYFFRLVVCFCKRSLSTILGSIEFKLPGGVSINYSMHKDDADSEIEKIETWAENNRTCAYFEQPNTL